MGDITGRPKAPSTQVVYVPQYVYENPSSGNGSGTGTGSTSGGSTDTPQTPTPSQEREKNLLSRSRSRMGTILTGFRGILAPKDTDAQRKTLLGE